MKFLGGILLLIGILLSFERTVVINDSPAPARGHVGLSSPFLVAQKAPFIEDNRKKGEERLATWYDYSLLGAPGYSRTHATAASRVFPRGTYLIVSRGIQRVVVRVNDYGPEEWTGKDIDLSSYAFSKLTNGNLSLGVIGVRIQEL